MEKKIGAYDVEPKIYELKLTRSQVRFLCVLLVNYTWIKKIEPPTSYYGHVRKVISLGIIDQDLLGNNSVHSSCIQY